MTLAYIYKVNKRLGESYAEIVKPFGQFDALDDSQRTVFGKPIIETFYADVVAVIDGDTIKILKKDNEEVRVRLESIDAPDRKQAFGMKARQALSDLVFGNYVMVLKTGEDRDGSTLAFVDFNGVNVNAAMIQDGCAWQNKQNSKDEALARLENEAREANLGLWGDSEEPVAPWDWQKR